MADKEYPNFMTTKEATERYVHDGDSVVMANFAGPAPVASMHEIIRQKKKNLTFISSTFALGQEEVIAAGCISKIITSYVHRATKDYNQPLQRGLHEGWIEIEDYSNWIVCAMLTAGAQGLPFFPLRGPGVMQTDIFKKRSFVGEDKFRVIDDPFKPEQKVVLVPPLNPDVALIHVGRADKKGNAQLAGPWGCARAHALACERIIVSAEEIVPEETIYRNPNLTIIPSHRTTAVVEEPWGSHPYYCKGYYDIDTLFAMLWMATATVEAQQDWINEWVYGVADRRSYIEHYIEKFGLEALLRLKSKEYPSATVNLGSTFMDFREQLRVTDEQMSGSPELFEVEV